MIPANQLPNTDCKLSALSLGTVKFGRNQSVKYPSQFNLPSDQDLANLLSLCQDLGISSFDTAPAYGMAEERLGKLLQGKRQQCQIISKAGELYDAKKDTSDYDYSSKSLERQLDNSLRLLKTDYLDCWLLHSDGNDISNLTDEIIYCLQRAKQAGKVLSTGLSGKTVDGGKLALEHLDTIMMTSSLSYHDEDDLFKFAQQQGKKVLLKKIYNSGWIVDQSQETNKQEILEKTYQHLFNTVGEHSVASAVVGTINPQHLKENVAAFLSSQL